MVSINGQCQNLTGTQLIVDPLTSRQYGWVTRDQRQVILNGYDRNGLEASLAFNTTMQDLVSHHILSVPMESKPVMTPFLTVDTNPAVPRCVVQFSLEIDFDAIIPNCNNVSAYINAQ